MRCGEKFARGELSERRESTELALWKTAFRELGGRDRGGVEWLRRRERSTCCNISP